MDQTVSDFLPDQVFSLIDPKRKDLIDELQDVCAKCTDTLLIYYSGHGILTEDTLELILSCTDTEEDTSKYSGLLWSDFKEIVESSRAKNKIIILDCCFAGAATLGASEPQPDIDGTFIIGAVPATEKAVATDPNGYTLFSGNFIRLLEKGFSCNSITVSVDAIYDDLEKKSTVNLKKSPRKGISGNTGRLKLLYNTGYEAHNQLVPQRDEDKFSLRNRIFTYIKNEFAISKSAKLPTVLLVKVVTDHPVKHDDFGVPLGLWSLKSYLNTYGYSVDILDERLERIKGKEGLNHKYIFSHYDVIGFSVCSCEVPKAIEYARISHSLNKINVFGGIFTKSNESYLLSHKEAHFVIPGVATAPFLTLLETIKNTQDRHSINHTIRGVYSKKLLKAKAVVDWEAESLPYINNTVYKELVENYKVHLGQKIDIVTGRGCVNTCKFCSVSKETSKRTLRDDNQVIKEIERHRKAGFTTISIKDENFVDQEARVKCILETSHKLGLDIDFKIKSRIDTLNKKEKLIPKLKKWGVNEIQFGVESLDPTVINSVDKGYAYSSDQIAYFFDLLIGNGIRVNASFVLGMTFESTSHHETLFEFINRFSNNFDLFKVYVNFYTPHPYDGKYAIPSESGLIFDDLSLFTHKNPLVAPNKWRQKDKLSMLECYEDIASLHDYRKYNPPVHSIIRDGFLTNLKIQNPQLKPIM